MCIYFDTIEGKHDTVESTLFQAGKRDRASTLLAQNPASPGKKTYRPGHKDRSVGLAPRHALVRSIGNGLWEIRTDLPRRIARVIFCIRKEHIVLLHGFIKKTQSIPKKDIELAKDRMDRL